MKDFVERMILQLLRESSGSGSRNQRVRFPAERVGQPARLSRKLEGDFARLSACLLYTSRCV